MRTIIGLDYSMTSPGVCVRNGDVCHLYAFYSANVYRKHLSLNSLSFNIELNVKDYEIQIERFDLLARKVLSIINTHDLIDPVAYIEGYSMGSKGQVFGIAENTAILKHYFYKSGIALHDVAPTSLKKFASGNGKAKKQDMHDAFMKETGLDLRELITPKRKLGSPVTDLIDAYYVAAYGKEHQGT